VAPELANLWAVGALDDPIVHFLQKCLVGHGNGSASFARMKTPCDQGRAHVQYDLGDRAISVAGRVFEQLAKLNIRDSPRASQWTEGAGPNPVRLAACADRPNCGPGGKLRIGRRWSHGRHSPASPHAVRMAVIALARIVAGQVAIHTAGMTQHWNDRFKVLSRGAVLFGSWRLRLRGLFADEHQYHCGGNRG